MQNAFEKAKTLKKKIVFLKAMDSSTDSIHFYRKLGFEVCDTLQLTYPLMKEEYRGMVIMKKVIES